MEFTEKQKEEILEIIKTLPFDTKSDMIKIAETTSKNDVTDLLILIIGIVLARLDKIEQKVDSLIKYGKEKK